ncbi:MAG: YqaA family protein [Acidobacteriota bacterium]
MDTLRSWIGGLKAMLMDLWHWMEGFADSPHGGSALFLFAFAESSFFPIPPDVLLIPLCLGDPSRAFWFAALCSAGSVLGGMAGYGIGRWGGRPLLLRMFKAERVRAVEAYFDRYNAWATGIAGLTPIPYKVFTLSGGAFAINFKVFVIASVLSRSLRFFSLATLIYFFGEPIRDFIDHYLDWLSLAFVVLLIVGFWFVSRRARAVARQGEAPPVSDPGETPTS